MSVVGERPLSVHPLTATWSVEPHRIHGAAHTGAAQTQNVRDDHVCDHIGVPEFRSARLTRRSWRGAAVVTTFLTLLVAIV